MQPATGSVSASASPLPARPSPHATQAQSVPAIVAWCVLAVLTLLLAVGVGFWLGQRSVQPVSVSSAASASSGASALVPQSIPQAPAPGGADSVALSALPALAQQVYGRIAQGGPFAFDKDGTIFFNRERLLPAQARGYYREYTVARPNAPNRGSQRIVCGGPPRQPHACWYTADHYQSFLRIQP